MLCPAREPQHRPSCAAPKYGLQRRPAVPGPQGRGPGLGARGHRGKRRGGRFPHVRREGWAAAKQLPRRPLESGAGGRGLGADPRTPGCCSRRFQRNLRGPRPPPPTGTGPGPGPCGTRTRREGRAEGGRSCFCPTLAPLPCSGRRARPGESAPRRGGRRGGEGPPGLTKPSRAAAGPSRRLEPSLEPPCPPRPGEPSPGAPAPPARHGAGGVGGRRQPTPRGRGRGRTRARGCGPP